MKDVSKIKLIWDLDGTLFDSYSVIIGSVCDMLREYGVETDYDEVHRLCIKTSMTDYLRETAEEQGLPFDEMLARYTVISQSRIYDIKLMPHAIETLQALQDMGVEHFVYTHRGTSTIPVTDHLGLTKFFTEIVTSVDPFPRKPAPDAVLYLMEKHGMDDDNTYYVGDRAIDILCGVNAGIRSILYLPDESVGEQTGKETLVIKDLYELVLFFK